MISQGLVHSLIDGLVVFATDLLVPFMCLLFTFGVISRALIYYTVKREHWFAKEFDKRTRHFLDDEDDHTPHSFYVVTKKLLEKTFYELFELRAIMKRRRPDKVQGLTDRLFLVQHGSAWLVRDSLKQIKYLKYGSHPPKLLEISKSVFHNNPCFSKVFGVVPAGGFNDVLNILPGIFIIMGIFGTFLGIMKALPELSGMDLADIEGTKMVMDQFLVKISFAMSTSIMGIILSVAMSILNTVFSPEKLFVTIVDKFENSLDNIWNRCEDNRLPESIPDFDEHRDPLDSVAADSIQKELGRSKGGREAGEEQKAS